MLLAMEKLNQFQPINIASGEAVTIREVLGEILRAASYEDAPIEYDSSKPTMIPRRMIDISLAKKILGWQPKVSLEEGTKKTVDWYTETNKNKASEDLK
jgi:nucleoside-diphosphate-sugar epimerase